ncbi:cache domain-containing protein [Maridesulfovibrio ferrireducens]|uniref:cache domain-containing protein n=1 Tax=Maridesulfovibrio ferrireducens TaxID=246191 RepID=UPI001A1937DF|nr:cache domain-containing protein [Maridesulfovibrio ferrireducens]MBI9110720.1 cache domain-containing protein [Maridesulfovibrio ferrireducens]
MDNKLVKNNEKILLRSMPTVEKCLNLLTRLDRQWTMATLTGKINCSRIAQTLIDFIISTQENFSLLKQNLVETLVIENTQKVVLEVSSMAQVVIDILKRNLFERTADVGFLATDDDLVRFLKNDADNPDAVAVIEDRLLEYRNKYTVYNEIIILDTDGKVCAHLDHSNPVTHSCDPLLAETYEAKEYLETYRKSDLTPERDKVLIYSQAINSPDSGDPLGILCLVFDFEGEMEGIFKNLKLSSNDTILMILDENGKAIASSDMVKAPIGRPYTMTKKDEFNIVNVNDEDYMAKTVETNGYQGFLGLTWYGHVLQRMESAFNNDSTDCSLDAVTIRNKAIFSGRLITVEEASKNVLSDLELVVQNGEIMAAKKCIAPNLTEQMEGRALPSILNEIKKIGDQVQHVFQSSTDGLLKLTTSSRLYEVQFLAQLSIDIMDRNLYERANDCRWWALTSDFRRILEQPQANDSDRNSMHNILHYINSLYTVYTNLFIYDHTGKILACSNPEEFRHEGQTLNGQYATDTLKIKDSQKYCVSSFDSTELYAKKSISRHSYIYNASITSLKDSNLVLGGIGIVFDSEPEFLSMLNDALPRNSQGEILNGSEGMFVETSGKIISSTNPDHNPGQSISLPQEFRQLSSGQLTSYLLEENDKLFAVGCAHSAGYREYKKDDGYTNNLLSIIKVRI